MAGFNSVNTIYVDPSVQFDALEGILEPVLNVQGVWDRDYGHVVRGMLLKRVAGQTVQGIAGITVDRPMVLGKVVAVSGSTVTLDRGAAGSLKLAGKTLTKVTEAGAVSDLTVTVVDIRDTENSVDARTIYPVKVTFSGAHGLTVGDYVGCEGLKATDVADGVSYESHNADQDTSVAVVVRGVLDNTKVVGPDAFKTKALVGSRVRDGLLLFCTF